MSYDHPSAQKQQKFVKLNLSLRVLTAIFPGGLG